MTSATQTLRADAQVIGLVGLGHGTSHFFHLLLAPLFPWLKDAFGLSYAELGLLMTVFFIVSGVGQALAGFVVDPERAGGYLKCAGDTSGNGCEVKLVGKRVRQPIKGNGRRQCAVFHIEVLDLVVTVMKSSRYGNRACALREDSTRWWTVKRNGCGLIRLIEEV